MPEVKKPQKITFSDQSKYKKTKFVLFLIKFIKNKLELPMRAWKNRKSSRFVTRDFVKKLFILLGLNFITSSKGFIQNNFRALEYSHHGYNNQ